MVVPGAPAAGRSILITGGSACDTTKPLMDIPSPVAVPAPVVTVTPRAPGAAPASIAMTTGSDVDVAPDPIVAVTPAPENVTEVAPFRFVPLIVADTVVPCSPPSGVIDVILGS